MSNHFEYKQKDVEYYCQRMQRDMAKHDLIVSLKYELDGLYYAPCPFCHTLLIISPKDVKIDKRRCI